MLMLKALKNRSIAFLWLGQALSAIGDEIYRVALIWIAVGMIGADTGYLASGQYAALLALSLVGGKWADRWNHFRTMIWVDALRAIIVLVPVVCFHFRALSLPVLWAVALALSGLSAFFDPALQATLPRYSNDISTLQAANGLMSTTSRIARVLGPALIGLLTPFVATIQFFTVDAISFGISAISVFAVAIAAKKRYREFPKPARLRWREALFSGFQAIHRTPTMSFHVLCKGVTGGAWGLAYGLGLALLVHKIEPQDMRAFGWVIAAYGAGNLAAVLVLGNIRRRRPAFMIFCGYVWLGVGILLWALSSNLRLLMATAAFAAIGGPLNDLPFVDLLQTAFPLSEIPKVFRVRMVVDTGSTLVCMLFSPFLFRVFSTQAVIAVCGLAILVIGLIGLLKFTAGEEREGDIFPKAV